MFLGVDGGGSGTELCLVDADGRVRATTTAPSAYYFAEGLDLVGRVLRQGVGEVCAMAGTAPADVRHAFFGLPSYGEVSADVPALDAAPRAVLGHDRYAVGNDMVCGWAGSLAGADGINVISGTGSMTYGQRGGTGARVGGWGELFGDEGSAHWIALRGLGAFTRMSDGRLPPGPLQAALRGHLGLGADLDVIDVVLNRWKGARREVAALARVVSAAADAGDLTCRRILADAARELALLVDTTRLRLGFAPEETVPVSYSGGVFASEAVLAGLREQLGALHDRYELRRPLHPPVVGAALHAASLAGTPLDAAALDRLTAFSSTAAHRGENRGPSL